MFNVHVRVNDAATGQPTPVRLRIGDATGRAYPPLGRVGEFATGRNEDVGGHLLRGRELWFYVDGSCEVPLPSGVPLTIAAAKGPEYVPVLQETTLGSGQMALRIAIERRTDWRARGWFPGDARCHFLTPHAALLEAMAEDLAVVELLALQTLVTGHDGVPRPAIPNMLAFSGQQPALERAGHLVAVNTLNTHPVLGRLALLHCHRAVYPLGFGGAEGTDDWSLADWCDQCHRKKGLVVWTDPFALDSLPAPEALADLILGRIDAIEAAPTNLRVPQWYRAWSAGIRAPLVGASGKDSNRVMLGALRTYARLSAGEALSLDGWIEAVRAGRTFVTAGPLLEFSVGGQGPGSVIDLDCPGRVCVRVEAHGHRAAELVVGGALAEELAAPTGGGRQQAEYEILIDRPTWLAARCPGTVEDQSFAHTSPVFVRVAGKMPADADVARRYHDWLGQTVEWVDSTGRFDVPRRKQQLRALLEQARQKLLDSTAGG